MSEPKLLLTDDLTYPNGLEGLNHVAMMMPSTFWGDLPSSFEQGTMVVEADREIVVTILKTRNGEAFSALPLARGR